MANHKSAIKRIRQTERRSTRNRSIKSRLRSTLKSFESAVEGNQQEEVNKMLSPTVGQVDKSVQKGLMHRNKANRIKSRLSVAANKLAAVNAA